METLVIYTMEQIAEAIFDVPGDFLQTSLPSETFLLMKIRDEFVDVMCEVNHEYIPYMIYENGKKVLYKKILRAIYGCTEREHLWYKLYSETLEGM